MLQAWLRDWIRECVTRRWNLVSPDRNSVYRTRSRARKNTDTPFLKACALQSVFRGTLAPRLRAAEKPMAMACFRLVTRPPLPPLPEQGTPFLAMHGALDDFGCSLSV